MVSVTYPKCQRVAYQKVRHSYGDSGKYLFHNAAMTDLGRRIKEARKRRGLTQAQLASMFQPPVSRPAVSQWESGETTPDPDRLAAAARILNVSVDWLLAPGGHHTGQRLAALRARAGVSADDLTAELGWPAQKLADIEAAPAPIAHATVRQIAVILARSGIDESEVMALAAPATAQERAPFSLADAAPLPADLGRPTAERPHDIPTMSELPRDVPVFGVAEGGADGTFEMDGIVDYVRRPPGIARQRNVYAIYVVGDSMSPRYDPGDLVFVSPARAPGPGSDVVIQLAGDSEHAERRYFIKRLVRRTATDVILRQFNPEGEIVMPLNRIVTMHRVLTAAELMGA